MVLLHIPAFQAYLGSVAEKAVSAKLGTKARIGRIDLGFLNRLIVDDVVLWDQQGRPLAKASRLSAKVDWMPLLAGRISISSAQLFGLDANLYRPDARSPHNFQFVLDSLASRDTTSHTPLDLQIKALVIRNGSVAYHQLDQPTTPLHFNPSHLHVTGLSTHLSLDRLTDDSLCLDIKKLAFMEQSGLEVKSLTGQLECTPRKITLSDFALSLPNTAITSSRLQVDFPEGRDGKPLKMKFNGTVNPSHITLSDLAPFHSRLARLEKTFDVAGSVSGDQTVLQVSDLHVQSQDRSVNLLVGMTATNWQTTPQWQADIRQCALKKEAVNYIHQNVSPLPEPLLRLGDIRLTGQAQGTGQNISGKGVFDTEAGTVRLQLAKNGNRVTSHIDTQDLNVRRILDDAHFGKASAQLQVAATLPAAGQALSMEVKGHLPTLDYNNYTYRNITLDGRWAQETLEGTLSVNDPNANLKASGSLRTHGVPQTRLTAQVNALSPHALHLSGKWPGTTFSGHLEALLTGKDLNTMTGEAALTDFTMRSPQETHTLQSLRVSSSGSGRDGRELHLTGDFGHVDIAGQYDYATLQHTFTNLIGKRLPTLPGLPKYRTAHNNFNIDAMLTDTEWLQRLTGIPLEATQPIRLQGVVSDQLGKAEISCLAPSFMYDGTEYRNASLQVSSPQDSLKAEAHLDKIMANGKLFSIEAKTSAADNKLGAHISFNNHDRRPFRGTLHADARFFKDEHDHSTAHVNIHHSDILLGDSLWHVEPSDIVYRKDNLIVDHFAVRHNQQHVVIAGNATPNPADTLVAELQDVDISYILNLVNFHSVEFGGQASGRAYVASVFGQPEAAADLTVRHFRFEDGRMGTLAAQATLNNKDGQIDIDAVATDLPDRTTTVKGYVSPQRNYIDLQIGANHTRAEFLESFCGSFMRHVDVRADGDLRLYGPLDNINLTGQLVANGTLDITSLNTTYTLRNDTIRLIPDEIVFKRDTIYDRNGNIGILNGSLYHQHLTRLTYDLGVQARNLLAYDTHSFGEDTFYGTAYATGTCQIKGGSGEVNFDIDAVPEKGSIIVYNAASPDAIGSQEFIHWQSRPQEETADNTTATSSEVADTTLSSRPQRAENGHVVWEDGKDVDIPTDIHINFLIRATPEATLRLIMDEQTGDYIDLNGNGVLRATYYNKGSFNLYGNYVVDHGIYKLTIQNVIKKDFQFQEGGTIAFGGDPYSAILNLKALYTVNAVPLSDLNIGRSFSSNNIRVNCLMDITGTPSSPHVDFGLDMPTVGTDAKQMVLTLINSEEEMNQQVLYLLAVGRFYNQGSNNAAAENAAQQSQTSLAMQSILSGTISQQINNVLSSMVNNANWNFGANISTGDEGWNNAQYEGLLSGRLLNNRLLINGEFGYRDNANATTSFIGDFDIRYLLYPNGNLAVKVYNQTNDRYFTRNSLNTQGIGFILKKDFNGLRDLFRKQEKKKKE